MKGSIRPQYSTASHATMDETAMALSARLESHSPPPSAPPAIHAFLNTVK